MHRLLSLFGRTIVLVASSAVITALHPLMLVAIAALLGLNFLLSNRARSRDKQVNDTLAKVRRKLDYVAGVMSDFAYGKDIRLFGMNDILLSRYGEEHWRLFDGHTKIQQIWLRAKNVFALTSLLQEGIMYVWLCWRVVAGGMGIGDFTMYALSIRAFSGALGGLLDDVSHIRQQNEVICDFRAFLDHPGRMSGSERLPAVRPEHDYRFELENVSFLYPGREDYALRNVSLVIQPGERLAVVGLNGAGKSTFVKLLTRLYEPEEGSIMLNGVDVRTYDKREYYRLFSVVFQETHLFALSVAENVSMREYARTDPETVVACLERAGLGSKILALPKGIDTALLKVIDENGVELSGGESQKLVLARALYRRLFAVVFQDFKLVSFSIRDNVAPGSRDDDGMVRLAVEIAGLGEKLAGLPLGLDTPVHKTFDEGGIEFSGGESQKLAIARAVYKDSPIVILDEPTAALDPLAEYEVYRHFDRLTGGKTAIYISHRLSSCRFCDRIVVFDQGRIVEDGTHDELVAREGLYARMWKAQAQWYSTDARAAS